MRRIFQKFLPKLHRPNLKPANLISWVPPLVIFFLSLLLCIKSYTPNTFLTGWDTLHPEFNFSHAFQSVLWGVWRSDQGLGAISAHSHMSELPRLVYLWLASFVFPLNFLRYSYFFLSLFLGPLGVYFFLNSRAHQAKGKLAALVSGLYYLLNLGTVSRFSVPFEMFATQFAALPWLFWFGLSYIDTRKKKYLAFFAIASFLGSAQAYAATLFYAFAGIFILSLLIYSLFKKSRKNSIKRFLLILVVLFTTNAYWILPNFYSIRNQSQDIKSAKINELFTPEAKIHNQEYGSFSDIISQKSYLFSWDAYDFGDQKFTKLLDKWNTYLADNKIASLVPILFAIVSLLGILVSILTKNKMGISLLLPSIVSIFFLMNNNGPSSGIFTFLQNRSGLFAEGFRDPYTKFSVIFSLFLSVYIFIFLEFLYRKTKFLKYSAFGLILGLIILFKPAFETGLVDLKMRVSVPSEYFEVFKFFEKREGRVAQLPLNSMWGWQYNSWGYQGAGFVWFGINNPYLTRDFDRWSESNETFYLELSRAYFSEDISEFEKVLTKYNVKYLFLDGTIINPSERLKESLSSQMISFLKDSKTIKSIAKFGKLEIFETQISNKEISVPKVFTRAALDSRYSKIDYTYNQYGDYMSGENGVIKPFINFDSRELHLESQSGWITTTRKIENSAGLLLTVPDLVQRESILPVSVKVKKENNQVVLRFDLLLPKIKLDNLEVSSSPIFLTYPLKSNINAGYLSVEQNIFDITQVPMDREFHDVGNVYITTVDSTKVQLFSKIITKNTQFVQSITSQKASLCSKPSEEVSFKKLISGFTLLSKEDSVCLGSLVTLPKGGLFETSFTTPRGESPLFCLNQIGRDGCINILQADASSLGNGRTLKYRVPAAAGAYWFAFVAQSTPSTESLVTYSDLNVSYYDEISSGRVDFGSAFRLFSSEKNVELSNVKNVTVTYFAAPIISENFGIERGHASAVNCSSNKDGSVSKEFVKNGVTYGASGNGVSCDYFDYPQLLQAQAYLMTISGENMEGRGLKFYLQNKQTGHMDFEELLPSNVFSNSYVVEPFKTGVGGYVLNIETRSFGRISSSNFISEISFSPLPTKWLTEIAIGPKYGVIENNNLKISRFSKVNLGYKIEALGAGIFGIDEAFEKGWVAISREEGILSHFSINGWQNGWRVTGSEKSSIYVFYMPQLLEWFGFVLILSSLIWLTRRP